MLPYPRPAEPGPLRPTALGAIRVVVSWIFGLSVWLAAWGLSWTAASDIGKQRQPDQVVWAAIALVLPTLPWIAALIAGVVISRRRTRALRGSQTAAIVLGVGSIVVCLLAIPKPA